MPNVGGQSTRRKKGPRSRRTSARMRRTSQFASGTGEFISRRLDGRWVRHDHHGDGSDSRVPLQGGKDRTSIHGPLHGLGHRVHPIVDGRNIATEFLQQHDELGDLLLGKDIHLQVELRALLSLRAASILCDENDARHKQSPQPDHALKLHEWGRVEGTHAQPRGAEVETGPRGCKGNDHVERARRPEPCRGVLEASLVPASAALGAYAQRGHRFHLVVSVGVQRGLESAYADPSHFAA